MPRHKAFRCTKVNKHIQRLRLADHAIRLLKRASKKIRLSVASEDFKEAEKRRLEWMEIYKGIQRYFGLTLYPIPDQLSRSFVK
jgi:hypothetical protein